MFVAKSFVYKTIVVANFVFHKSTGNSVKVRPARRAISNLLHANLLLKILTGGGFGWQFFVFLDLFKSIAFCSSRPHLLLYPQSISIPSFFRKDRTFLLRARATPNLLHANLLLKILTWRGVSVDKKIVVKIFESIAFVLPNPIYFYTLNLL